MAVLQSLEYAIVTNANDHRPGDSLLFAAWSAATTLNFAELTSGVPYRALRRRPRDGEAFDGP